MKKIAVFPGSFDPVTRGHESLILRALDLFDEIIIAVGENPEKRSYFSLERRKEWLSEVFAKQPRVRIEIYSGLTVDFCRKMNAGFILRGLRTSADFEFERSIGQMNRAMEPGVETVFLLSEPQYNSLSSSIVRDILLNGGNVSQFVPASIRIE
jgi:pantetheine-phosphate adenylyltransferase